MLAKKNKIQFRRSRMEPDVRNGAIASNIFRYIFSILICKQVLAGAGGIDMMQKKCHG